MRLKYPSGSSSERLVVSLRSNRQKLSEAVFSSAPYIGRSVILTDFDR